MNWLITVLVAIAGGTVGFAEVNYDGDAFDEDDTELSGIQLGRRLARGAKATGPATSQLAIGDGWAQRVDTFVFKSIVFVWLGINAYFYLRTGYHEQHVKIIGHKLQALLGRSQSVHPTEYSELRA